MLHINVKELFYEKNPKLAKKLPNFVYKIIERRLCVARINQSLSEIGEYKDLEFANAVIDHLKITYTVVGAENLPEPHDGKHYIFVSNHPLGGIDGCTLIQLIGNRYGFVRSVSNDVVMTVDNMSGVFLPINSFGGQSRRIAEGYEEAFDQETPIIVFPAGICSRPQKGGVIEDRQWRKNFVSKAIQHHRDIVPIHFIGLNSRRFYRINRIRKFFGIKLNIEMIRLPREVYLQEGAHFTIVVGKPIPYTSLDKSKNHQQWADTIRAQVYSMNADTPKA